MKSVATLRFWHLFQALPSSVKNLEIKNYHLWRRNPNHPSRRFRRLQGDTDRFTVRIGDYYRALGRLQGDTLVWVWIGTHADYDRLIRST